MKRLFSVLLILVLVVALAGCSANDTPDEPQETAGGTEGVTEISTEMNAEQPILLTSVGQSADVEMVKTMIERNELEYVANNLATSADIGDAKTLILAVGGSSKGLGAAGIDANAELERIAELVDEADKQGLTIIAAHIGGEARRGELSDRFIAPSFEKADYAIVVSSGDKDGIMSNLAKDGGFHIDLIDTIADTMASLEKIFN